MNYNTELSLWVNLRAQELKIERMLRNSLKVVDGHIFHKRERIGRFNNSADAEKTLSDAGWFSMPDGPENCWVAEKTFYSI